MIAEYAVVIQHGIGAFVSAFHLEENCVCCHSRRPSLSHCFRQSRRRKSEVSDTADVSSYSAAAMPSGVACGAKRDQVLFRIIAGLAAEFLVVNLKIRHRAAVLASPSVSP